MAQALGVHPLADRVADGQVDWDDIYLKLWPLIRNRAGAKLGLDAPDLQDIAQEVFLGLLAFIRSGRYRKEARLETIAYKITEARIMDFLRKKYAGRHRNFTPREIVDLSTSDLFVADYENRMLFKAVMGKLNVLTERQRTAFLLCGVAEMPLGEAAGRMNISRTQIGKLFQRAKEKLAVALKGLWKEPPPRPKYMADDLTAWVDKAFNAYACLGRKIGHWNDGIELAAAEARTEIKRIILKNEAPI